MKNTVLLIFFQIALFCNAQEVDTTKLVYTQKLEYGIRGSVKEVKSYTSIVNNGMIPTDTSDWTRRSSMTFDSLGNAIDISYFWHFGADTATSEHKMTFSGKGKAITFKGSTSFNKASTTETSYKFVWLDDYQYNIVREEDSVCVETNVLNEAYGITKKSMSYLDNYLWEDEIETLYEDNRIAEIKIIARVQRNGEMNISREIQVVQKFDTYGNPTVLYEYNNDEGKQELEAVIYRTYTYF